MHATSPWILSTALAAGLGLAPHTMAADEDALALESTPTTAEAASGSANRMTLEAAIGRIDQRYGAGVQDGRRVALDVRWSTKLNEAWRMSLSDRLDDIHPVPAGQRNTRNSLREAYAGWQEPAGTVAAELGRVNLRHGPAFGYNPTDYFRIGASQTITTADPVALRENRLGTAMLRLGQLWTSGGVSLAVAPKMGSVAGDDTFALDLGSTNATDRALLTVSGRLSDRLSGQALLLAERGQSPKVGASMTALVSDASVAYAEWSYGKSVSLQDRLSGTASTPLRAHQAALGLTYTLPSSLALTVELEYNGAGLDQAGWNQVLSQGPAGYQKYIALTQPDQELGVRRAWLLYAMQKGIGLKQLDLTAFVRTNAVDQSRLAWAELRYHWPRFDAALQWQRSFGDSRSEYGAMPYRQVVQLVGFLYF